MLNRELLNDSAILLLGVYLREMQTPVHPESYAQMFTASLLTRASTRKQF